MSIYDVLLEPKKISKGLLSRNPEIIENLIKSHITWARTHKEAVFCYRSGIFNRPECEMCSNTPELSNGRYKKYCSKECYSNDQDRARKAWSVEARNKRKKTSIERYGTEHPFQNKDIQRKYNKTCMDRYGSDFYMKTKEFSDARDMEFDRRVNDEAYRDQIYTKIHQTMFDNTGYYHALQNHDSLEKMKNTTLKNHGEINPSRVDYLKEKAVKTNLERYGYKSLSLSKEVQDKRRLTHFTRTGYEYPMQNPDSLHKNQISAKKLTVYEASDGNQYQLQGYEWKMVELLIKEDLNFVSNKSDVGYLKYNMHDKTKSYFPDFKLEDGTYVEVKSDYTLSAAIHKMSCVYDSNPEEKILIYVFSEKSGIPTQILNSKQDMIFWMDNVYNK